MQGDGERKGSTPTPSIPRHPATDEKKYLDGAFSSHELGLEDQVRAEHVRNVGRQFAELILDVMKPTRERSIVLTRIEEATFWANAGLSRHGGKAPAPKKEAPRHGDVAPSV